MYLVASAERSQPDGFIFFTSLTQFAVWDFPDVFFAAGGFLQKLCAICNFWTHKVDFSWQAQKLRNLQFLDLPAYFFVAGARHSPLYGFRFGRKLRTICSFWT